MGKKSSKKKKTSSKKTKGGLGKSWGLLLFSVCITLFALIFVLKLPPVEKKKTQPTKNHKIKNIKQKTKKRVARKKINKKKLKYEEKLNTPALSITHKEINKKAITQKKGYLILIIDDIGRDLKYAKELIHIFGSDINLSILPYSPHSIEIDNLCRKLKIPTLLHMPMEPISYPETDPGPGALLTTMPNNELRNAVKKNLMSLPYIVGVNNHMGSKFTQDSRGMKIFLTELKKRHLFFIDSGTTPKSVAQKLGRELGILVVKRDIFIDNEKDIKTILKFLKKAEKYSLKKGVVIAIGHPYPETIAALKIWKKQKNPQVTLIPVTRLLKKNGPPGAATHIYSKTKSS